MIKTLFYGWKILQISWYALRYNIILMIFSRVYEGTLFPLIQIILLARLLDLLTLQKNLSFNDFLWLILSYLAAMLLRIVLKTYLDAKEVAMLSRLQDYIELKIDTKLTELDPAVFEDAAFQDLLAQMDIVRGSMSPFLDRFIGLADAVFKFITASFVVGFKFPIFISVILISTIPSFIVMNNFREKIWPFFVEERSKLTRFLYYIKNLLSSDSTSKEVTVFKIGTTLVDKASLQEKKYINSFEKAADKQFFNIVYSRLFHIIAFAYTQYLNIAAVLAGKLTIGSFTLYFQQTLLLAMGAEGILENYSSVSMRTKYVDKYFEFMDHRKMIRSPSAPKQMPVDPMPPVIEFRNVSFHYPGSEKYILKNFNLKISTGEKMAFVGQNGVGKTTIIKLLLRFYDVTEGEVLINGINIKEIRLDNWHKLVGVLFQDFIKYQFTFKENVYFGNLEQKNNLDLLKKAIEKSGADAFVKNLPEGFDQTVGKMFEGGIDLSGGQWQKLALARAFFRDAPILILDEPTSAIDAKAEYEIFQKVQSLQKDKTVIIISHRFSTVRNADRIHVLEEGKIIEQGSHEKLMKYKGLYAELFNLQAQGYK